MTTNKSLKKDKKRKDKKTKKRTRTRTKRNNSKSSNLSDLYTYESPVTNKPESRDKSNSTINNVNIVDGLKAFLAVKK